MATRRRFIRDCSALVVSATLVPASVTAAPRRWREVSLANVAFGTLVALVNSTFVLRHTNGDAQALELIEAALAPGSNSLAGDDGGESFSLFFRGDATRPLGQNSYAFDHSRIGRFEMFIVPIGREAGSHCYYEAVFNRPPPESLAGGRSAGHRQIR